MSLSPRPRKSRRRSATSTASSTCIHEPQSIPQIQVEVDLAAAQRYGIRRVACAERERRSIEERGGRRHLLWRQGLRRPCLERSRVRQNLTDVENLLMDAADGSEVQPRPTSPKSALPPRRATSTTSRCRDASTSTPTSGAATSDRSTRDVTVGAGRHRVPAGVPPRAPGRVRRAQGRRGSAVPVRDRRRDRRVLPAPHLVRQHAPCRPVVPDTAVRAGWRRPRRVARNRRHLARLAGRLLHRVRHRLARNGIMMINHFQHLETRRG